jgi:hypothetical protein
LISAATSEDGFPRNYALVVAPYWLHSHRDLTFETYQEAKFPQGLLQTFTVSVATAPLMQPTSTTAVGTRLGYGFSANLLNGRKNPGIDALIKALDAVDEQMLEPNANIPALQQQARDLSLRIQTMNTQRVGFIVSMAGGSALSFPSDDFAQKTQDRWGLWVTPTYRLLACPGSDGTECNATVDFMAVFRSLHDAGQDARWDTGARLLWQPTKDFNLSIETLHRSEASDGTAPAGQRTVGMLEYTVRDGWVLYGSFGKDHPTANGREPLVSIFGLNVGFGKPEVKRQP